MNSRSSSKYNIVSSISTKSTPSNNEDSSKKLKREALIKLQEVYKNFRTRKKSADCAVFIEQICWKILEFAELKRSSISFFNKEKHETAISRWSRAKTRAAKVGKGLSENDKALKLTLRHWLEAIDPRHRYGHNLEFYYDKWFHSNSKEPFFYWLDFGEGKELDLIEMCPRAKLQQQCIKYLGPVSHFFLFFIKLYPYLCSNLYKEPFFYWLDFGEGKELDLIEMCPRSKLQQQCIKYLGPMERIAYEVVVDDGKFLLKQTWELLHTPGDAKWIFVLSTSKTLYVGQKKKGTFQHSSFLAGGATIAAGTLVVEYGVLKAVWPHSNHYRPKMENLKDFISFLRENNVDLTDVKMTSSIGNQRYSSSEKEVAKILNILGTEVINLNDLVQEKTESVEEAIVALELPKTKRFHNLSGNLTHLEKDLNA
ncbi:hypothetical protein SLEP1_g39137 [Rubroshorea leprosula]|uniref:LAGLIDADG homing endonuclease n=1 Tax=Rubroshorea leprosula TaxID=152421 RepID=A0AAV5KZ63_9ROSI|nr:hypothetical protein SLEP1_g39137 [Rubroshorea leprosula]